MVNYLTWLLQLAEDMANKSTEAGSFSTGNLSGLTTRGVIPPRQTKYESARSQSRRFTTALLQTQSWKTTNEQASAPMWPAWDATAAHPEQNAFAQSSMDRAEAEFPAGKTDGPLPLAIKSEFVFPYSGTVGALYDAVTSGTRTLEALRQQRQNLPALHEPAVPAKSDDLMSSAEDLDRYFQRDARRYDGAFSLL